MHSARPTRRRLAPLRRVLLALSSVAALGVGCNRAPCAGLHPPTQDANAPQLVAVEIVSQDVINPWQLNLAVDFTDRDGDLGSGLLEMYVGTSEPTVLGLAPYFASSELGPNSRAGRLGIDINLSSGAVQDDNVVRLGFQLRDTLQNYSNCYTLDLHFDVDKLGALTPGRARWAPCGGRLAARAR